MFNTAPVHSRGLETVQPAHTLFRLSSNFFILNQARSDLPLASETSSAASFVLPWSYAGKGLFGARRLRPAEEGVSGSPWGAGPFPARRGAARSGAARGGEGRGGRPGWGGRLRSRQRPREGSGGPGSPARVLAGGRGAVRPAGHGRRAGVHRLPSFLFSVCCLSPRRAASTG